MKTYENIMIRRFLHRIWKGGGDPRQSRQVFSESDFEVNREVLEHLNNYSGELDNVSAFVAFRTYQGIAHVKVNWQGLPSEEDASEDIRATKEEVPAVFAQHIQVAKTQGAA